MTQSVLRNSMGGKVKKITKDDAVNKIKDSNGSIFTVVFKKRTDGQMRLMNCRTGVRQHLKGGQSTIWPIHNLITVFDMQSKGYRSIPKESITFLKMKGHEYIVG